MFCFTTLAKRAFLLACFCLTLALFPLPSCALTVQDVPNPRISYHGWVTDMAQILNPVTEIKLNQIISKLERENGSEIAVVTVGETAPSLTPKAFTTELFNYWGIGKKEQNNGVLFLVSVGDRRVEIETGYGVRNILKNADVNRIIQQKIIPQFKQGNFENGILIGTKSLIAELSRYQAMKSQDTANSLKVSHQQNTVKRNENGILTDTKLLVAELNGHQAMKSQDTANSLKVFHQQNTIKRNYQQYEVLSWLLFAAVIVFAIIFWVLFKLSYKVDTHNSYSKKNYSSGNSSSGFRESDGEGSGFSLKMMKYKSNQSPYHFDLTSVAEGDDNSSSSSSSNSSLSDGGSSGNFWSDGGDFGGGSSGGDGGGGDW